MWFFSLLGGDVGAKEARLSIMVGGEEEAIASVKPLFEVMGKNIVHLGPPSSGQHTKMVNQIFISTTMVSQVPYPWPKFTQCIVSAGWHGRRFAVWI